jgi:hypothetical protein
MSGSFEPVSGLHFFGIPATCLGVTFSWSIIIIRIIATFARANLFHYQRVASNLRILTFAPEFRTHLAGLVVAIACTRNKTAYVLVF